MLFSVPVDTHPRVRIPIVVAFISTRHLEGNLSEVLDGVIEFTMKRRSQEVIVLGGESNHTDPAKLIKDYVATWWSVRCQQEFEKVPLEMHPPCPDVSVHLNLRNSREKTKRLGEIMREHGLSGRKERVHIYSHWRSGLHLRYVRLGVWWYLRSKHSHVHVHEPAPTPLPETIAA